MLEWMDERDLRMKLLAGDSITLDGFGDIPVITLGDIKTLGYTKYNQYLRLMTITIDELTKDDVQEEDTFDLYIKSENDIITSHFIEALKFFFKESQITINSVLGIVIIGDISDISRAKVMSRDVFIQTRELLKYQNNLSSDKSTKSANKKAQEILAKLNKSKKVVEKVKGSESGEEIDLVDIISAVSTTSKHYDKFNIWNLTVYQLYDEYNGIDKFLQYKISIDSLMHGADSEKVQVSHWSSKSVKD